MRARACKRERHNALMRGLSERLRGARARAPFGRRDERIDECGSPWTITFDLADRASAQPVEAAAGATDAGDATNAEPDATDVRDAEPDATDAAAEVAAAAVDRPFRYPAPRARSSATDDASLASALNRVADAFEKLAEGLEADRRERSVRLDAVEALVRELVTALAQPTATPPVVVGGTIDLTDAPFELTRDVDDDALSGLPRVDGGVGGA